MGLIGFVIAKCRPKHALRERICMKVENGRLVLGIGSGVVRIIAKHQPYVHIAASIVGQESIAYRSRIGVRSPLVAKGPDTRWLSTDRRGPEKQVRSAREIRFCC